MFAQNTLHRHHLPAGSGNLVEFRAGRMNMIGKMVHPDPRKGLVYMTLGEDGLMHFCWKDRTTDKVEDDLIVFPDDFEFKHVDQCKTGRVYVLKFKASTRRMFFWMQEPRSDKDEEYCRRVNELLQGPPPVMRANNGAGNNMTQQELAQLYEGVGLSGMLSNLSRNREGGRRLINYNGSTDTNIQHIQSNSDRESNGSSRNAPVVDLSTAISGNEAISQVIADPERAKKLSVLLPESENGDEKRKQQIEDNIASPQFQEALSRFSTALQSAQLGPVVSKFELTPDAVSAAFSGNLEDFVKALEKSLPEGTNMPNADEDVGKKEDVEDAKKQGEN